MTLFPYQAEGVKHLLELKRCILADEPGLGKTAQALTAWGHIAKEGKINCLVICPASLCENWERESNLWCPAALPPVIVSYNKVVAEWRAINGLGVKQPADYYGFFDKQWDCLIIDESHALKAKDSQRSRYILSARYIEPYNRKRMNTPGVRSEYCFCLTGTPILNAPCELYNMLHHLQPDLWPSRGEYERHYCDAHAGPFGWDVSGSSHEEELSERIFRANPVMIRRRKSEVLKDLPPKMRTLIALKANKPEVKRLNSDFDLVFTIPQEFEFDDKESLYQVLTRRLDKKKLAELEIDDGHVATMRRQIGELKAKTFAPVLVERAQNGERLVVFAHHHQVFDTLANELANERVPFSLLTGSTPSDLRQREVDNFQRGKTQVFLGSVSAAGVGLTLTTAHTCIMLEYSWVPAENIQCEDRLHRIGQAHDSVSCQYVALDGSIDLNILKVMMKKLEVSRVVLDSSQVLDSGF